MHYFNEVAMEHLMDLLESKRDEAREKALEWYTFVSRRKEYIVVGSAGGCLVNDLFSPWDGTADSLNKVVEEAKNRNAADVLIQGGFDGAPSEEEFEAAIYEPGVQWYSVSVWQLNGVSDVDIACSGDDDNRKETTDEA